MPANKNALIRYKTIDNCLCNRFRKWTLQDLVEACSDALYELEGVDKGVSLRTIQSDIQMMRSDKLGYNAPIEVYEHKYYRYADPDYSITNMPLSPNDLNIMQEAIDMLKQLEGFTHFSEMSNVLHHLQEKLAISSKNRGNIIHFDSAPQLKGLHYLTPLYDHISQKHTIKVTYQSFSSDKPQEHILYPHLLKEFRNRWFLFGSRVKDMLLYNLSLDRIIGIETIDIPYKENPDFDTNHFFDDVIGVSKHIKSQPHLIIFWADAEQSHYIKTKPIHNTQKIVRDNCPDGSCIFSINVVINFEMYSTFMSYGAGVKVLSPRHVASYMKDKLRKAANLYASPDSTKQISFE